MIWYFTVIIFLVSCCLLSWLSSRMVKSLVVIARYLRWREFIIAFFVMAMAASLPDFFIDVNAAWQGKPLLALGDILGGNLVDLTLVLAIAAFFSKKSLSAASSMVQKSAVFTTVIAVLPLLLMLDNYLGRIDGVILILAFLIYAYWLFSKSEHFKKFYHSKKEDMVMGFKSFLWNVLKIIILAGGLIVSSQAVIWSAGKFADGLGISIALVGILIVGLGNSFPDLYFSVTSAKHDENWLVLGELMGSVIICATLVLGTVALFFPFAITDFAPFATARIILILAAVLSLIFIRTGRKITKKEGLALLGLYVAFLIIEIFIA